MNTFTVFPAIDLRAGQVVRLQEGDPSRQTVFSHDPAEVAYRFLSQGARWLHVVNLDGAFGEEKSAGLNLRAIEQMLEITPEFSASLQVGGGVRSLKAVADLLVRGVRRLVVGTMAIEHPELLKQAVQKWGEERIAVSLDVRNGMVYVRGWQESGGILLEDAARFIQSCGVRWVVFTDISRDGMQTGLALDEASALAEKFGFQVIVSGGARSLAEVRQAREQGLAGVILGRALYEGKILLEEALREEAC